ncbi:MAG TPA: cupin domain-containing protein [Sphingomicrobium sp.]
MNRAKLAVLAMMAAGGSILAATAGATPGSGFTPNPIGGSNVGTLDLNTSGDKTGKWGLHLKTLSSTDISADRLVIQPGGHSGWHTHPGPVLVVVTQGSVVWANGSDPLCTSRTYSAGEAFIEEPFVVHKASNASPSGGVGAEYLAFTIKPAGAVGPAFRIDRPQPNNCNF